MLISAWYVFAHIAGRREIVQAVNLPDAQGQGRRQPDDRHVPVSSEELASLVISPGLSAVNGISWLVHSGRAIGWPAPAAAATLGATGPLVAVKLATVLARNLNFGGAALLLLIPNLLFTLAMLLVNVLFCFRTARTILAWLWHLVF